MNTVVVENEYNSLAEMIANGKINKPNPRQWTDARLEIDALNAAIRSSPKAYGERLRATLKGDTVWSVRIDEHGNPV